MPYPSDFVTHEVKTAVSSYLRLSCRSWYIRYFPPRFCMVRGAFWNRLRNLICALILLVNLAFPATISFAQHIKAPCRNGKNVGNNAIGKAIAQNTGGGTTTVYSGATDGSGNATGESLDPAIVAAFTAWNANTSVTGVNFQQAPTGTKPTIPVNQVTAFTEPGTGCVGSSAKTGDISYDSNFINWDDPVDFGDIDETHSEQMTDAVEHEIGHLLGLEDQPSNAKYPGGAKSVMDDVTQTGDDDDGNDCDALVGESLGGIQSQDAANAATCDGKCAACAKKNSQ